MNDAGTAVMNAGKGVWNYRLPTLKDGTSTWAAAVNNNGMIVGAATGKDGTWHAVAWTLPTP